MKQILQSLKSGATEVAEVPCPEAKRGQLLICTSRTLVSAGTERMLVEFGKAGLLDKARQQPDKVRMVLDKIKADGLLPTIEAVRSKLDQPLALGYCNAGVVIRVGEGVDGFSVGDRVVSNGFHAEVVCVPKNLCAKIPDGVSDEEAAFTVIGAIGLQGVRLAQPTLGEGFVVTGLGIIGLITLQILQAHGCRVLGVDLDSSKCAIARQFGAETVDLSQGEDPIAMSQRFSRGRGVDGVIITAATKSSEPVHQAALMCRKRGRIVLVGVTGLELSRDDFYKKELTFQVSCSYGPGRYDPEYEEKGRDYPLAYVRWTEQRNFEAVLDLMAAGKLDVRPLISHRFPFAAAEKAYEMLGGKAPYLGIILEYGSGARGEGQEEKTAGESTGSLEAARTVLLDKALAPFATSQSGSLDNCRVSFIGAGNYAGRVLMPAFKRAGAVLYTVVSSGGVSAVHYGKKFGFRDASTDAIATLSNDKINAVVIATRHNSHASLVLKALQAGKHIFVEKPLCLTLKELAEIAEVYSAVRPQTSDFRQLMVGFNRRFAPQIQKMKQLLDSVKAPKSFIVTVNAGAIPADHWTQDPEVGGGRIIGEACHFVDLLRFLTGAAITDFRGIRLGHDPLGDKATLTLSFDDGSMGTIHYFANGHNAFPKERIEVFCAGRVLALNNFRKLKGYGWPGFKQMNLWRQDKGQATCAAAFVRAVQNGAPNLIPFDEIMEVARITIELSQMLRFGTSSHGDK